MSLTLPSSRLGNGRSSLASFGCVATAGAAGSWLFADGHQDGAFRSASSSFCRLWLRFGVMGTKHGSPFFALPVALQFLSTSGCGIGLLFFRRML